MRHVYMYGYEITKKKAHACIQVQTYVHMYVCVQVHETITHIYICKQHINCSYLSQIMT